MIENIQGGIAKDHRGQIRFVNDFDMSEVKRFYIIKNTDLELIRGWRAHRIEQRWFYVLSGSFKIDLAVKTEIVKSEDNKVLHLSSGYGAAFQAIEEGSELLVFSDFGIENAPKDDYTYPVEYFVNKK